jgi:hypothetical protein
MSTRIATMGDGMHAIRALAAIALVAVNTSAFMLFATTDPGGGHVRPFGKSQKSPAVTWVTEYDVQAPRAPGQTDTDEFQAPATTSPRTGQILASRDSVRTPYREDELQAPRGSVGGSPA